MTFPRQFSTQLIPHPIALCVLRLDAEPLKALVLHGPYLGIDEGAVRGARRVTRL
jgi:hypothetical protein